MSQLPAGRNEPEFVEQESTPIRKAIADRVVGSHQEVPVFHMHAEVDAEPILALRKRLKAEWDTSPSVNDIILKCCATALPKHPTINAAFVDDTVRLYKDVNVGFAVATQKGVLVPVVRDALGKGLDEIAVETREMISQARKGRLRASLQQGGTFSISNIGPGRIIAFDAIIPQPQTAILAIGAVGKRPWVADDQVVVRSTMHLTLRVDHRAIDGADGAKFIGTLAKALERPDGACGVS